MWREAGDFHPGIGRIRLLLEATRKETRHLFKSTKRQTSTCSPSFRNQRESLRSHSQTTGVCTGEVGRMPPEPYFEIDPDPETAKRIRQERDKARALKRTPWWKQQLHNGAGNSNSTTRALQPTNSAGSTVHGPRGAAGPRWKIHQGQHRPGVSRMQSKKEAGNPGGNRFAQVVRSLKVMDFPPLASPRGAAESGRTAKTVRAGAKPCMKLFTGA